MKVKVRWPCAPRSGSRSSPAATARCSSPWSVTSSSSQRGSRGQTRSWRIWTRYPHWRKAFIRTPILIIKIWLNHIVCWQSVYTFKAQVDIVHVPANKKNAADEKLKQLMRRSVDPPYRNTLLSEHCQVCWHSPRGRGEDCAHLRGPGLCRGHCRLQAADAALGDPAAHQQLPPVPDAGRQRALQLPGAPQQRPCRDQARRHAREADTGGWLAECK